MMPHVGRATTFSSTPIPCGRDIKIHNRAPNGEGVIYRRHELNTSVLLFRTRNMNGTWIKGADAV